MGEDTNSKANIFNADDTLDINELASLNDDISPEFIEQLQNQVAQNASEFTGKTIKAVSDDSDLFEEVQEQSLRLTPRINIDESIDDNFIKKYKAKLNKQQISQNNQVDEKKELGISNKESLSADVQSTNVVQNKLVDKGSNDKIEVSNEQINDLSSGNIIEKPLKQEQIEYNESLDLLDNNVKYSKYVIYIDPENTEFMESLTVKERKNLINRIIREQDDISLTKRRLRVVQMIIKHAIVAIITVAIAVPITYWIINASLEASIDNYRRSKTVFKTLYREKGKIKTSPTSY